jgi:gluconate 2-dehydrogenase gamma chain
MIPTDDTGPGAKEAGVIFFIDRQLAGDYGHSGSMYMQGPFVQPNQAGPITVNGITYAKGSSTARMGSGAYYQYSFNLREFWRYGLAFMQAYSNSAYGGNFETLSPDKQTLVLQDLWNNKPTNFTGPTPQEFFAEMHDMVWAGFLTDPIHGGNQGMVGWTLTGFNGSNTGNFYGEGLKITDLMVAGSPTRLKPASLAQLQGTA